MATSSAVAPTGAVSNLDWRWLLAIGILMTALGVIGLGMSYMLTLLAVFWFGVLALIGGAGQLFDSFHHKGWKSFLWHLLIALVYIAAGVILITTPIASAFWLTLFLAISMIVVGVARIIMAFQMRDKGSVWLLVALMGVLSIVLGFMVWGMVVPPTPEALATPEGQVEWVRSWGWVIGLFVALELIVEGVALISIALSNRPAAAQAAAA